MHALCTLKKHANLNNINLAPLPSKPLVEKNTYSAQDVAVENNIIKSEEIIPLPNDAPFDGGEPIVYADMNNSINTNNYSTLNKSSINIEGLASNNIIPLDKERVKIICKNLILTGT